MKRRLLAILLTAAMLLTLLPAAALADEQGESTSPFTDVQNSGDYFYKPVLWASENQIVYGTSDTTFSPNAPCTRAQVVTFLYRAAGKPAVSGYENPFEDVKESDYFYKAVLWGYQNKIVYGTSNTNFSPEDEVTRAQFIAFLYRFADKPGVTSEANPFTDVPVGEYYYKAVLWGSQNKIVYGTAADQFSPEDSCTRAQVVTFLYRYYNESAASSEPDTISELYEQISEMVSGYSGTWSVYLKRLDTGESFVIHDTPMVSASLIKLYVYGEAYRQIEAGALSRSAYSNSMTYMISASDNTACNVLVDAVGGTSAVNDFIRSQGWSDTVMNRKMLQTGSGENYTSVSECGDLLERVYNGTYVSADASADLLNAMLNQYRRTKIPAGIPYGTKCANKTGELSDVENDAAIVYSPACDYILVVMSDEIMELTAQSEIKAISSAVYNYLNQK